MGSFRNENEFLYGNEGDDTIWAGSFTIDEVVVKGGSGNDNLYGAYSHPADKPGYYYGEAGRDLIRTDWYQDNDPNAPENYGNEYIYGDFKYGAGALDKDLWGDADIIIGGRGDRSDPSIQQIHAGDGDDQVYMGDNWRDGVVYGENGNDTINVGATTQSVYIEAGEGNDTVNVIPYADLASSPQQRKDEVRGQGGNDTIQG